MRKILSLAFILSLLALPAKAEFSALERGSTAGRIIYSVSEDSYFTKTGQAITESDISSLSSQDYGKTGLVADGNSRLILRYKSSEPGTVAFSVSPSISGSRLERFTDRKEISAPISTVSTSNGYQASAVFIAPEAWPSELAYPKGNFTVTATFTPLTGNTVTESLNLTLQAPPIVLIHGVFTKNEKGFGYAKGSKTGVWHKLEDAGLTVASWNYDSKKTASALIGSNTNGLANIIADTLNTLNNDGIAATRVDLVTYSTGGLMARQYLRNDTDTGNKTANSYGLGTVRRVVTIASPNLGSPIASYLAGNFSSLPSSWQNWQASKWWETVGYLLIKRLAVSRNYDDEVMSDFSLDSSYIAGLGYPGIPFHSIYGKIKSDEAKIGKLFDDVVNQNKVALAKITWLPEQLVDTLTSSYLAQISGVLQFFSDDIRFKEVLGALYGDDDYDLVVSETSAKDKFPSNALTSFTGLATHSHITIAQQNDVAERVLELLKGSTDNFSINTVSTAEYDAAFSAVADSFTNYIRASEEYNWDEYFDNTLSIDISALSDDGESIVLSCIASNDFSNDVYIVLDDGEGATKFFVIRSKDIANKSSFDVSIQSDSEDKGIFEISCFTVLNNELKISDTKIAAYPPKFDSATTPVVYWSSKGGNIYAHVGEQVSTGLIVQVEDLYYDISDLALGVASYDISDKSIAEITNGKTIKALKEGSTTITATAYGKSATVNFIVKQSASEEDTTRDITVASNTNTGLGSSSGGGCNVGLGALILLATIAMFTKKY